MGEKRGRALFVMPAAVLALGIAAPASASFNTSAALAPRPLPPSSQQLAAVPPALPSPFAASVEVPSPSLGLPLSWSQTPAGPRPYFGARYYGSKIGRFTTTDPVYTIEENLLDPQRWNRYAYARNNPLRYVDPDGRTIVTYFGGLFTAFGSNLTGGLVPRPSMSDSDFQFGQHVGDVMSVAAAAWEASVGGGVATGGTALTVTVAGAEVGIPAGVAGGAMIAHAGAVGAAALLSLSKNSGDLGSIYKVPGSATASGKPYIGRHNKPNPAKTRRSRDGRDRTQAEVIDNYDASNTQEGRVKEQGQIDQHGLGNLDNKRNEIRKD
jgi:RHS repeat-associated protein